MKRTNFKYDDRIVYIKKDGCWDRRTGLQWRDIYIDGKWRGGSYQTLETACQKALERIKHDAAPNPAHKPV